MTEQLRAGQGVVMGGNIEELLKIVTPQQVAEPWIR
jgi:hypothetical protein